MTTSNKPDQGGANTLPIGFTLAEFRIEHVIGEGGFGIVYMATDTQLGRKVAIKEYMPASLASRKADLSVTVTSPRHKETFDLGLRSFVKEAITLARFDHPALLKVFRFWEERGTAYMVMPYLEGQTLKQFLRSRVDAPPEAWLRTLLEPVLDGLEHLHSHNILHRDIAPDNIQILPNGVPLLLDFGAARQVIGDATQALTVILKPGFAPVEQYAETAAMRQGAWTDVYALAAVCYYAISGKTPQASVSRVLNDDMPSAASIGAQRYSPEFLNFIDVCLRVRPEQRPQTMREARDLMLGLVPAPPMPAPAVVDDDRTVIRPSARAPAPSDEATIARTTPRTTASGATTAATAMPMQPTAAFERTAAATPPSHAPTRGGAPSAAPPPSRRTGLMAVAAVAVVGAGLAAWKFWPSTNSVPAAPTVASAAPAPAPAPTPAPASAVATPTPAPTTGAATSPTSTPPVAARLPAPATAAAAIEQVLGGAAAAAQVTSQPAQASLTIGRDTMQFRVRSAVKGYVYVLATNAGSDTLTLLYPNALDQDNAIAAGAEVALPHASWSGKVVAPAGTRTILSVVSASPRDLTSAGWKRGSTYYTYTPGADTAAATAQPPVLGAPACAADAGCDASYGAATFQVTHVEAPAAPVVDEAKRTAPARKPPPAETTRTAKPANENAQQCALLLQQASMGQDTPEIARKMAALGCR